MMNVSQISFIEDKNIKYQTINALVQRKRQIRINISTPNTSRMHPRDTQTIINTQRHENASTNQQDYPQESIVQTLPIKQIQFQGKNRMSCKGDDDLYQVIYRQGNKMASIGWFQETPTKRNSNMSRTFRRRRRSNLQDYSTINDSSLLCPEQIEDKDGINSLRVNNLELSGFTNEQIVKKVNKSALSLSNKKNNNQFTKYPKIITFIGESKVKRVELILPKQHLQHSAFQLCNAKIKNKWKYSVNNPQSKSNKQFKLEQGQHPIQSKKNQLQFQHPFIKKIQSKKPEKDKATPEKRIKSHFMHSRPRIIISNTMHREVKEGIQQVICRPWSVKKNNMEEKIDEGQQSKPSLISQIQQQ